MINQSTQNKIYMFKFSYYFLEFSFLLSIVLSSIFSVFAGVIYLLNNHISYGLIGTVIALSIIAFTLWTGKNLLFSLTNNFYVRPFICFVISENPSWIKNKALGFQDDEELVCICVNKNLELFEFASERIKKKFSSANSLKYHFVINQ